MTLNPKEPTRFCSIIRKLIRRGHFSQQWSCLFCKCLVDNNYQQYSSSSTKLLGSGSIK